MSAILGTNKKGLDVKISGTNKVQNIARRYSLLPEEVRKASVRAINRTLRSVRTLGARIARETYTAPTRELTKNISVKNAKASDAVGQITFAGNKGISLHLFQPSPKKQPSYKGVNPKKRTPRGGISTKIKKQGSRKVKFGPNGEKPFWVTTKKGRQGLFYRKSNKGNDIRPLFGPSPIQALLNEEAQSRLHEQADNTFSTRLAHEIKEIKRKMEIS